MQRDTRDIFKEKLADTYIDWQAYACMLLDLMVVAEIREKNFCEDSRWWYDQMMELDKCLTEKQKEYFSDVYEDWIGNK